MAGKARIGKGAGDLVGVAVGVLVAVAVRVTVGPPLPLPDSLTVFGPAALSATVILPPIAPLRSGEKLAPMVHCALG